MVQEKLTKRQVEIRKKMQQRIIEVCKGKLLNGMRVCVFKSNTQKSGIVKSLTIENQQLILRIREEGGKTFEASMLLNGAYIVETNNNDGRAFITDNYPFSCTQEWRFSIRAEILPEVESTDKS